MPVKLTPRLMTAVPYVRGGRLVADIGTDHAYLPIYLCEAGILTPVKVQSGQAFCAIASDIHHGPVERAFLHVAAAGLSERILTVRTDGLCGLDAYDPADIIIFGMGGELIASILAAAPWVQCPGKRLILQPMTHAEKLRAYLPAAGFSIIGETLSQEGERLYQTICAEPIASADEDPSPYSLAERAVGRAEHRRTSIASGGPEVQMALYRALIDKTIRTETAARDARRRAARQNTDEADALLRSLEDLRDEVRI